MERRAASSSSTLLRIFCQIRRLKAGSLDKETKESPTLPYSSPWKVAVTRGRFVHADDRDFFLIGPFECIRVKKSLWGQNGIKRHPIANSGALLIIQRKRGSNNLVGMVINPIHQITIRDIGQRSHIRKSGNVFSNRLKVFVVAFKI